MREIKFRAWDGEQMRNTFAITSYGETIMGGEEYPNWKIMQFTGLKDKNGKEIYEGDVVVHFNKEYIKHTVLYKYGAYGYMGNLIDDDFISYNRNWYNLKGSTDKTTLSEVEVIGNIYENPELI